LRALREPEETFSDVILRLTELGLIRGARAIDADGEKCFSIITPKWTRKYPVHHKRPSI
jgi:hypothetical protein